MVERGETPTKLTILGAMHFFTTAWDTVSMATVQPCFHQCGFERAGLGQALAEGNADEGSEDAQEMETKKVGAPLTYSEYLSVDEDVVTAEHIGAESDEDVEDAVTVHATPTFADAIVALDTLRSSALELCSECKTSTTMADSEASTSRQPTPHNPVKHRQRDLPIFSGFSDVDDCLKQYDRVIMHNHWVVHAGKRGVSSKRHSAPVV
ncbi:hypothetical protein HPB47_001073 [Ixodes persulcatus]|uniref:Uncharacterized protein n=1 Tax=Ixodes persulcatus TaxID=34615 RepID=A0AC60PRA6_IXOPE|nr:hypothetical protein HPB47_001073 [Ixodes persulcatus]